MPTSSATRTSSRSAAMTACTLIYEALKKTGGKTDGEALIAAAKGMTWESPRGPISIDPETRDIVQTVYIRRVEKVGGKAASMSSSTRSRTSRTPVKARMKKRLTRLVTPARVRTHCRRNRLRDSRARRIRSRALA